MNNNANFFKTEFFLCPFCKDISNKLTLFNDSHACSHLFDSWSFFHIIGGLLLGLLFDGLGIVIFINFLFEFFENSYIGIHFWSNLGFISVQDRSGCDTYMNILGDTICVIFGFFISKKFGFNVSLVFITIYFLIILLCVTCFNSSIRKQLFRSYNSFIIFE